MNDPLPGHDDDISPWFQKVKDQWPAVARRDAGSQIDDNTETGAPEPRAHPDAVLEPVAPPEPEPALHAIEQLDAAPSPPPAGWPTPDELNHTFAAPIVQAAPAPEAAPPDGLAFEAAPRQVPVPIAQASDLAFLRPAPAPIAAPTSSAAAPGPDLEPASSPVQDPVHRPPSGPLPFAMTHTPAPAAAAPAPVTEAPAPAKAPGGPGWSVRPHPNGISAAGHEPLPELTHSPALRGDMLAMAPSVVYPWQLPPEHATRRSWRVVIALLLGVVLVTVVGFAGTYALNGFGKPHHTISKPASIGTLTSIDTPATAAIVAQMNQQLTSTYGATSVVSGIFGAAGHPSLIVMLAQPPNLESTSEQAFTDYVAGLRTSGIIVSQSGATSTVSGGADFHCAPATAPAPLLAVTTCMWLDGDTIGAVLDVGGNTVGATLNEAIAARNAGEH